MFSSLEQLASRPAGHSITDVSLTAARLRFADGEVLLVEEILWILVPLSGATSSRFQFTSKVTRHNIYLY